MRVPSVLVSTTWVKTRVLSEFHFRFSTPRHSAARTAVNRRPTFPGLVKYQLAYCAAIRLQRLCKVASSGTPPARCVLSLLLYRKSPYTSRNERCALAGMKPCRSAPYSVEGVAHPPARTKPCCVGGVGGPSPPPPGHPGHPASPEVYGVPSVLAHRPSSPWTLPPRGGGCPLLLPD